MLSYIWTKDSSGRKPLLLTPWNGHEDVVKLLLNTGKVDIDSKYESGQAPLLLTSENGHEAVVKLLLNTGRTRNGHEANVKP
ncbi:hypothetical protein jhhlp_003191 [Lomentospora prolificans]|uniref:Uncharacterized protein n=1 Tax=Lomentospora prolificans TaxID=41688 RepID=A0A2N3NG75_9PEZI|nr:hypothetical protein jhhlp_003191 [Lomentospora prolificans]